MEALEICAAKHTVLPNVCITKAIICLPGENWHRRMRRCVRFFRIDPGTDAGHVQNLPSRGATLLGPGDKPLRPARLQHNPGWILGQQFVVAFIDLG